MAVFFFSLNVQHLNVLMHDNNPLIVYFILTRCYPNPGEKYETKGSRVPGVHTQVYGRVE